MHLFIIIDFGRYPANTKHLYNIYTMFGQRISRFVFAVYVCVGLYTIFSMLMS